MAYERQTWACGDTITADKLNHIEEGLEECCSGGGSEPLVLRATELYIDGSNKVIRTNLTAQELTDALAEGIPCYTSFYPKGSDSFDICNANDLDDFLEVTGIMMPIIGIVERNVMDATFTEVMPISILGNIEKAYACAT